jgi:hypothetical protein
MQGTLPSPSEKMDKIRISLNDEEPEFRLIGISCHQKDYRAAWAVGLALEVELERQENWEVMLKRKDAGLPGSFGYFRYDSEDESYSLIANKSENGTLLPELTRFDYILLIYQTIPEELAEQLIENLKSSPMIQFCTYFPPDELKNWDLLPS